MRFLLVSFPLMLIGLMGLSLQQEQVSETPSEVFWHTDLSVATTLAEESGSPLLLVFR